MRLLTTETGWTETISLLPAEETDDSIPMLFHFYWMGTLNEKHFISLKSCRYFHPSAEILLWTEKCPANEWSIQISKIASIHPFNMAEELRGTFLEGRRIPDYRSNVTYYSDFIRCILLYKYGGIWADLDCFFLRNFSPLLKLVGSYPAVYRWESQEYPNNAIFISTTKQNSILESFINYVLTYKQNFGFQASAITHDTPIDLLVLPCSWFDPGWIPNPEGITFSTFMTDTDKIIDLNTFFKGCFCFHWHNKWNHRIEPRSILRQLANQLEV